MRTFSLLLSIALLLSSMAAVGHFGRWSRKSTQTPGCTEQCFQTQLRKRQQEWRVREAKFRFQMQQAQLHQPIPAPAAPVIVGYGGAILVDAVTGCERPVTIHPIPSNDERRWRPLTGTGERWVENGYIEPKSCRKERLRSMHDPMHDLQPPYCSGTRRSRNLLSATDIPEACFSRTETSPDYRTTAPTLILLAQSIALARGTPNSRPPPSPPPLTCYTLCHDSHRHPA
jgi:hypothetical protein